MLTCMVTIHAQTFELDGIWYNVTTQPNEDIMGEVEVRSRITGDYSTENIVIPAEIVNYSNTYKVTRIGGGAFQGRTNIVSVTIPNSVTTIERSAFIVCI